MCNGSAKASGTPRIVDRSGQRQLPVGVESFADMLQTYICVDKTLAIRKLVDWRGVTLFCRPQLFGKSTFLSMLHCFFEVPVKGWISDRRDLFDGLAIVGEGPRYMDECGTHPVIHLNLSGCGTESYDQVMLGITDAMADEYVRHAYLLESPKLLSFERPRFERMTSAEPRPQELVSSLAWLSKLLARHHGSQVVILIDDIDTPPAGAHLYGFRQKVLGFYRTWLAGALKGTVDLYCAALTGVPRVSQESVCDVLNNAQIDTMLDDDHAEAIGFTAEEAEALAAYVGHADRVGEMAAWYDGYRFGGTDVYNPWSVLNFLRTGDAQPYWTNASANAIVTDLIRHAGVAQTEELTELAVGGTLTKTLDLRRVFDDSARNPEAVWAELYQTGYVTCDDTGRSNDSRMSRRLRIPNLEVRELYGQELLARATHLARSHERLQALHRAFIVANAKAAQEVLRQILQDPPSFHDLTSEGAYHVLMLALLYAVDGYKPATSNREGCDGRCDVLLEPLASEAGRLPAHAIRLKLNKHAATDETLAVCASQLALAQARHLEYGHGLAGTGLVRWGIAFCGKRVWVVRAKDAEIALA